MRRRRKKKDIMAGFCSARRALSTASITEKTVRPGVRKNGRRQMSTKVLAMAAIG
jgi:hypothetical protein